MRFVYFLLLVVFVAAVGTFAYQNRNDVAVDFLNRSVSCPLALLIGIVYVAGMLSGWSVVGMLRRSFERVTERRQPG
jgi:uncharacterized membrane protein YciS (DUF1049 family)